MLRSAKLHRILILPIFISFLTLFGWQVLQSSSAHSGPNNQPANGNDSYTIHGSSGIGSVLANDSDADADPIVPEVLTFPTHGNISAGEPGYFFYTLTDLSFTGTDSFTYRACDSHGACAPSPATVSITVQNQVPVGNTDDYSFHGATTIGPMLANDTDGDGDQLSIQILTFPSHGTLAGLQQPDMKSYTPQGGYTGNDSFTYKVCDPYTCSGSVTVNLFYTNSPPVPVADFYIVRGFQTIGPLRANDTDPDGDPLSAPDVITFPAHGSLYGQTNPDLKWFNPHYGYTGWDTFTYRVISRPTPTTVTPPPARPPASCDAGLEQCLDNPWQPPWNRGTFGSRKDCGACYRECGHSGGVWPDYKCPRS